MTSGNPIFLDTAVAIVTKWGCSSLA